MLIRLIATLSVGSLLILSALGNFWFMYGLWPRSWSAFFGFALLSMFLVVLMSIVTQDKKK